MHRHENVLTTNFLSSETAHKSYGPNGITPAFLVIVLKHSRDLLPVNLLAAQEFE
jgi:hypothetical protein